MIEIPEQIKEDDFRFLLLREKNKEPIEQDWQNTNNYSYNNLKLLEHINKGNNYGIIGGYGNIILIDSDSPEVTEIAETLPETFTIKTGSPEEYKKHYFYKTNKKIKPIRLSKDKVGDLGDIRSVGQYVVAPNSIHPKGGIYKVIKDLPISFINEDELRFKFKNMIDSSKPKEFKEYPVDTKKRETPYIKCCEMPDYLLNNKIKGNSSKNWELFPYVVDISYNRGLSENYLYNLCQKQGHSLGAIKGWIIKAKEGKLMKGSCQRMKDYIKKYHGELIPEICGKCKLYNKEEYSLNIFIENKEEIAEKLYEINPYFYDDIGFFWFWNKILKCYDRKSDIDVMLILKGNSNNQSFQITKQTFWNETLRSLKLIGRKYHPEPFNKNWVQFKDKVYDFKTKEVIEPSPDYFNVNPLPYGISECKDTPVIDKIFTEWVGKENVLSLKESIGLSMIQDYPLHRIICLFGSGLNGKGRFLAFLNKILGDRNICSSNLNKLIKSNFECSKLYTKLGCIMGETNFGEIQDTSILKQLSGQDLISAEFKGKNSFDFYNNALLFIASNSLPISLDVTDGFFRRWMIIDFPNKFKEGPDPLLQIPEEEYNNFCTQMLDIIPALIERGLFSNDGDIQHRREKYEEKSSPLIIFLKTYYEKDINGEVPFFEFYDEFISFCKERGFREITKNSVTRILNEHHGIEKERKDVKIGMKWTKWAFLLGIKKCSKGNESVSTSSTSSTPTSYPENKPNRECESLVEHVESVENITKEETVIDNRELVNHNCHRCNLTPCVKFDSKGYPVCEYCQELENKPTGHELISYGARGTLKKEGGDV